MNMSDSRFMKVQKFLQEKAKKEIDKIDKDYRMEALRKRFGTPKNKPNWLQRIRNWLNEKI